MTQLEKPLPGIPEICGLLQSCHWTAASPAPLGDQAWFQTFQGRHLAPCRRFENEAGRGLLLIALPAIHQPPREELFARFLNLPMETRMALTAARWGGDADWLLLLTADRLELFSLPEESRRLGVTGEKDLAEQLTPMLASLGHGRDWIGGEIPHQPEAESLRGWIRHWALQLGSEIEEPPASAAQLLWKWILMLQRARHTRSGQPDEGWGITCAREDDALVVAYDAVGATQGLTRNLALFEQCFQTTLLGGEVDRQLRRLQRLDETALVDRLRAELLMNSQNRFEPETVAWLYTDLDREQEGWRREVRGVEPVRRRIGLDGWAVERPLVCDVGHFGLTAALRDMQALALYIHELRELAQAETGIPMVQPDLFRPTPVGVNPRGELVDPVNYLLGCALRVEGVPQADRMGVGLVLLLKAMALASRLGWPIDKIDSIDRVFEK